MPARHFPVLPNLNQLRHQAKDLLRAIRRGDPDGLADLREYHPQFSDPTSIRLADAQFVLARSYELPSWPRLVTACQMIAAIRLGDVETVRNLVLRDPRLLEEDARGVKGNWGPPLSYAANLGQDAIIEMLHGLGAKDLKKAFGRACLQSKVETARRLWDMMGKPEPLDDALGGPAYTLSVSGTELLLELGARVIDDYGKRIAPADVVLETDSRNPAAKHRILELYAQHGLRYPDTPAMAVHLGRIDLLEEHLRRDPNLLRRTFTHEEIFPPELGCHDEVLATHGTPLAGATPLHLCADYGEIEIARWLLDHGMNADQPAAIDANGFGGHTALFSAVVSQANNHGRDAGAAFTRLLLDHGANPNARASLRKQFHPGYQIDGVFEYRDVTPLGWGERCPLRQIVSAAAMELIRERGGRT
ncbi:MAG TPA: ankyrin repeat domain-containing protein [Acidobacteriaceae bacterium]|nr:ankyrin repeat domain-containing protein [Acidobacteriaceae bacterium]